MKDKHTKRQLNLNCIFYKCLSPLFVFYSQLTHLFLQCLQLFSGANLTRVARRLLGANQSPPSTLPLFFSLARYFLFR